MQNFAEDEPDSSLILFEQAAHVTFPNAELLQVVTSHDYIVRFNNSANISFTELFSRNCNAGQSILSFDYGVPDMPGIALSNSTLRDCQAGALDVWRGTALVDSTNLTQFDTKSHIVRIRNKDGSGLKISNCFFMHNIVQPNLQSPIWGTLLAIAAESVIQDTQFLNNTSAAGGAVCIQATGNFDDQVSVTGCYFGSNHADEDGGAIFLYGSQGKANELINITDSVFVNNTASNAGGAVSAWGVASFFVNGSVFHNNLAPYRATTLYANGFLKRFTSAIIEGSAFTGTQSCDGQNPPMVQMYLCACIGVSDTTFENHFGAALHIHVAGGNCETDRPVGSVELFNRNTIASDDDGNAKLSSFLLSGVDSQLNIDIRNATFQNLTFCIPLSIDRFQPSGAVLIDETPRASISKSRFMHNIGGQGAGLYMDAVWAAALLDNTFVGNAAAREGGAIAMVSSHGPGLFMVDTYAENNSALSGGVVYGSQGTGIEIIGTNTRLVNNRAWARGGVVYAGTARELHLTNVSLQANTAKEAGGGIHCESCVLVSMLNVQISDNRLAFLLMHVAKHTRPCTLFFATCARPYNNSKSLACKCVTGQ